jgi:cyclopropane-fatty-acyl-phospholipid synthase
MAEYAARHYGCRVTTTTLSQEQYRGLRAAHSRAGLAGSRRGAALRLSRSDRQYDKLVSVEMIEAVGNAISRPSSAPARRACARAAKWRFRPSPFRISAIATTAKASILSSATSFPAVFAQHHGNERADDPPYRFCGAQPVRHGPDYARTLAHWRQRFTHAWQDIEKLGFDERFRRMWLYYFGYCEAGLTPAPSAWCS